MATRPSEPDIDDGWDLDDEAPATRPAAPGEISPNAKRTVPRPKTEPPMSAGDASQRVTIPPPMPSQEYVQSMMDNAREENPEVELRQRPYRPPLATLMEIDPLRFDQPEPVHRPTPEMPQEAPSIETSEEEATDFDPDLLVNTVPPPAGGTDELDMLPFDEVLDRLSSGSDFERPSSEVSQVTTLPALAAGRPAESSDSAIGSLRLGVTPPALAQVTEIDETRHDRATLPGDRQSLVDRPNDDRAKMWRRFEAKDYAGALILAESLLEVDAADAEAQGCAEEARRLVTDLYLAKIGDRRGVPRVVVGAEQLQRLALDHRAGFLLSCIDGSSCLDELLDLSGMTPLETVRLLYELVQEGVLEVEAPPPQSSNR